MHRTGTRAFRQHHGEPVHDGCGNAGVWPRCEPSVRITALFGLLSQLMRCTRSVVQEAIIVRFFRNHGLGLSMAFGLVVGKFASFVAARTSFPLSERYGAHGPMAVATILSAFSLGMNLVYISVSRSLERVETASQQATDGTLTETQALAHVSEKRKVRLEDLAKLGDVFWA